MKRKTFVYVVAVVLIMNTVSNPCTFFMSTINGITFFGNNEDSHMPQTNVWFIPPKEGKHGYVYFGYINGWPQGGMNDQGLCFDGASTARVNIEFSPDKKSYQGVLLDRIMEECAMVAEVIEYNETYKFLGLNIQGQLMFVDKSGDAVVIGGPDKNNDIDIIPKEGKFLVLTNFFPNHPEMGGYPCWRYNTATNMLKKNPEPSVENFRSILKAVSNSTQYSNIFDLNYQAIYIYYKANFEDVVHMNLEDEFKKGAHAYRIGLLFPGSGWNENLEDLNELREKGRISRRIPKFIEYKKYPK